MGGKKKSLANRLARMSDEERARYLQHRADIEEEARRRKEQLIAIFLKHKIKREDGFSRLNLAKINQHWHQILRLSKCKEMKEDVKHMKEYMDRILEYKNRTINTLLEELEMAEEQYCHNFQAHYTHIDQIIGSHEMYMSLMEEQYQKDLEELLTTSAKENDELIQKKIKRYEHLQTVIFGQNSKAKEKAKADFERYLKKKEDMSSTFRIQLDAYVKQREAHCAALWRQIATVIKTHVGQVDAKRLHLAELKRLDAESAAEIALNQERITSQEEEIKSLQQQSENLTTKQTELIQGLKKAIKDKTATFFAVRQHFRKEVTRDEKQLLLLTHTSNNSIQFLEKLKTKGEQIVNLMLTCQKFETEREQVSKWLPLGPVTEVSIDEEEQEEIKRRTSAKSDSSAPKMVKKVVISMKSPEGSRGASPTAEDIVNREFALLGCMEKFWVMYNKVDLEYKELRQEKKVLLEQNKHFRGMIRAVLEAVALDKSNPESKVPTRAASKRRSAKSAPLRRILV